jgi:hypothetical protein
MSKLTRRYKRWLRRCWGTQCKVFDLNCPCCRAWAAYRLTRQKVNGIEGWLDRARREHREHLDPETP